jgi:hypothetical protein
MKYGQAKRTKWLVFFEHVSHHRSH